MSRLFCGSSPPFFFYLVVSILGLFCLLSDVSVPFLLGFFCYRRFSIDIQSLTQLSCFVICRIRHIWSSSTILIFILMLSYIGHVSPSYKEMLSTILVNIIYLIYLDFYTWLLLFPSRYSYHLCVCFFWTSSLKFGLPIY